jgi:hypothetical protein
VRLDTFGAECPCEDPEFLVRLEHHLTDVTFDDRAGDVDILGGLHETLYTGGF